MGRQSDCCPTCTCSLHLDYGAGELAQPGRAPHFDSRWLAGPAELPGEESDVYGSVSAQYPVPQRVKIMELLTM